MKVIIKNVTGSSIEEALVDKDSGVVEFKNGEISHVLYEKQMGKTIMVYKEPKKEEEKPVVKEEVKQEPPSAGQSKEGNKKKTKSK